MTEAELVEKSIKVFERYFIVETEVKTVCKTGRIDIVLKDKTNTNVIFGIEAKKDGSKRGEKIGEWLTQSIRYRNSKFLINNKEQYIPIMMLPALSYNYLVLSDEKIIIDGIEYHKDRHVKNSSHNTINGMLSVFQIGEVRSVSDHVGNYFRFIFANSIVWSNKPIWNIQLKKFDKTTYEGVSYSNYNKLINKINDNNL